MRLATLLALGLTIGASACVKADGDAPEAGAGAAVAQKTAGSGAAGCAAATFPDDRFIGEAFSDKFNGRYWMGSRSIDVWREGQRMFVGTRGGAGRQLQRASETPGAGEFRDGCGTVYRFVLPPDGPGGYVTITEPGGAWAEWHRR